MEERLASVVRGVCSGERWETFVIGDDDMTEIPQPRRQMRGVNKENPIVDAHMSKLRKTGHF
jgi:hypothetical protein